MRDSVVCRQNIGVIMGGEIVLVSLASLIESSLHKHEEGKLIVGGW